MPSEDCWLDRPSPNRNMRLYEGETCDWLGVQVAQLWAEGPPDGGRWELPGQQTAPCPSRNARAISRMQKKKKRKSCKIWTSYLAYIIFGFQFFETASVTISKKK